MKGFCCGDDEMDDYYFGEGTANALLSFQACNGLTETGVADDDTWSKLLGEDKKPVLLEGESLPEPAKEDSVASSQIAAEDQEASSSPPVVTSAGDLLYEFNTANGQGENGHEEGSEGEPLKKGGQGTNSAGQVSVDPKLPKTKNGWPAVAELDGGKEVHQLQALLSKHGFHCGEDDMNWWYFGSDTATALKTFQACNDLPESGVCDEKTWMALCGPDSKPSDLVDVESSYEEDRANVQEGHRGVWLLGEQRWEKQ